LARRPGRTINATEVYRRSSEEMLQLFVIRRRTSHNEKVLGARTLHRTNEIERGTAVIGATADTTAARIANEDCGWPGRR
jgi:hypothetical protein